MLPSPKLDTSNTSRQPRRGVEMLKPPWKEAPPDCSKSSTFSSMQVLSSGPMGTPFKGGHWFSAALNVVSTSHVPKQVQSSLLSTSVAGKPTGSARVITVASGSEVR